MDILYVWNRVTYMFANLSVVNDNIETAWERLKLNRNSIVQRGLMQSPLLSVLLHMHIVLCQSCVVLIATEILYLGFRNRNFKC